MWFKLNLILNNEYQKILYIFYDLIHITDNQYDKHLLPLQHENGTDINIKEYSHNSRIVLGLLKYLLDVF
jgi:hypothetical protein